VTVTNEFGCTHEEQFTIVEPGPITYNFVSQNIECAGYGNGFIEFQNIAGGTPPFTFGLIDEAGTNSPLFDSLQAGTYDVFIEDANGCIEFETAEILEPGSIFIEAGPDQTIKLGETANLNAFISDPTGQIIEWTPSESLDCSDCEDPDASPFVTTTYLLTVEADGFGCILQDSLIVFVEEQRNVYIPNIFSPNGDGLNDIVTILSLDGGDHTVMEFLIYDRWGSPVFENYDFPPSDHSNGWDGTIRGEEAEISVYVYSAKVLLESGRTKNLKGNITLIR